MQIFRYMFLIWDAYEKEAETLRDKVREKNNYQEAGMIFEASCKKLMEKVGLDENEAKIQINRYWK